MYLQLALDWYLQRPEEKIRYPSPRTGITDPCELQCRCWSLTWVFCGTFFFQLHTFQPLQEICMERQYSLVRQADHLFIKYSLFNECCLPRDALEKKLHIGVGVLGSGQSSLAGLSICLCCWFSGRRLPPCLS